MYLHTSAFYSIGHNLQLVNFYLVQKMSLLPGAIDSRNENTFTLLTVEEKKIMRASLINRLCHRDSVFYDLLHRYKEI